MAGTPTNIISHNVAITDGTTTAVVDIELDYYHEE